MKIIKNWGRPSIRLKVHNLIRFLDEKVVVEEQLIRITE